VPVTHFQDGIAERRMLDVSAEDKGPVNPAGQDLKSVASALNPAVIPQLTPTMARFALPGKVCVVTGAGRGLGYNMAQALSEVGVRGIAIVDVQQEIGEKSARELSEQTGVDVRFYKVDVRDANAVQQAIADVNEHYGQVDVLVNAAGIADSNIKAENYDVEKFRRLLDINITGSFLVAQAVARHMIHSQTGGSIVFIASMSGSIVNYPQEQVSQPPPLRPTPYPHPLTPPLVVLQRLQSRRPPTHQIARRRMGALQDPRQRHQPGLHGHGA